MKMKCETELELAAIIKVFKETIASYAWGSEDDRSKVLGREDKELNDIVLSLYNEMHHREMQVRKLRNRRISLIP